MALGGDRAGEAPADEHDPTGLVGPDPTGEPDSRELARYRGVVSAEDQAGIAVFGLALAVGHHSDSGYT